MDDYGRRVVLTMRFEDGVGETCRAIRAEGLVVMARVDLRDHFWRILGHDFRQYVLLDVWSPDSALEALGLDFEVGTILPTRFAVYELDDGSTAVVASEPFSRMAAEPDWRRHAPRLAAIADRETERVARVLGRLQEAARARPVAPAA